MAPFLRIGYGTTSGEFSTVICKNIIIKQKVNPFNEWEYKEYQPIATSAAIRLVDVLAKAAEEMPAPFGDTKCGFLPADGLPEEAVIALSYCAKILMF